MNANSEAVMAQAMVDAHAAAVAVPQVEGAAAPAFKTALAENTGAGTVQEDHSAVHRAALRACQHMGFAPADASIVAQAWAAQSTRLGGFDASLWPTNPVDFGLNSNPHAPAFAACPQQLGLYVVAPDAAWVGRLARAGVPTVQLRFKSDDASAVADQVAAAVDAVRGTASLLFINDHWQQAVAAGAYGVHLGQEDLDALAGANLEAIRHSGLRLGVSTHGYAEMLRADRVRPSYIAMGAVYATTLKRMQTPPQGPGRLAVYARLMCAYPLVAIGGIDLDRLGAVLASGVGSVAVVRAVIAASDPEAEIQRWMQHIAQPQNRKISTL